METIGDYIALDSPGNALRFTQGLRSCAHRRYVIFFRPMADLVRIERILHSAMDLSGQFALDADVGGD